MITVLIGNSTANTNHLTKQRIKRTLSFTNSALNYNVFLVEYVIRYLCYCQPKSENYKGAT